MKKMYSNLAILMCLSISFILGSCTADQVSNVENIQSSFEHEEVVSKLTANSEILPANSVNPYDAVGRVIYEKKKQYISQNPNLVVAYDKMERSKIGTLFQDNSTEIFNNLVMSADAKLSFRKFLNSFLLLSKTENLYENQYDFIVAYESSILVDDLLKEKDKEVILISTSVIRYANYGEPANPPKNKDPDWTIFLRVPLPKK